MTGTAGVLGAPLRSPGAAAFVAAVIGVLVYANALANGFAYDDLHLIVDNESIRSLGTVVAGLLSPYWPGASGQDLGLWRPATTLLLGLEYAGWGTNPLPYHLVNVLLHGAVSGVLVLLLARLMPLGAGLAAGLLFAVHPVHVEAVANVVGVAELGAALAYLLVCWFHVKGGERTTWPMALGAAAGYALAFSFKESAVTLPAALFLLDAARSEIGPRELGGYTKRRWPLYVALGAVAAGLLWARFGILGTVADPRPALGADILREVPRIWTLAEVWSHYLRLMVFPLDLASDYSPGVIPISLGWNPVNGLGAFLALAVLAVSLVAWRGGPMRPEAASPRAVGLGVLWFVVTVSPVANVVFLSGVLLAERALYLPSVGAAVAFGWVVASLARRSPTRAPYLAAATLVLVLAPMIVRTWTRTPTWKDNDTVFNALIRDYPHSGRSQWLLGDLFFRDGAPDRGLGAYAEAVRLVGADYTLLTDLGARLMGQQRHDVAVRILATAQALYPDGARAPGIRAFAHMGQGDPEQAVRYARMAVALAPHQLVWYDVLVSALAATGLREEAAAARMEAIRQGGSANWRQWSSLADLEARAGRIDEAAAALDSAWIRATEPADRLRVDSLRAALPVRGGERD